MVPGDFVLCGDGCLLVVAACAVGAFVAGLLGLGAMKYGINVATIAMTAKPSVAHACTLLRLSNASITERNK